MEDNDLVRGNWRYEDVSTWEEMDPGPSRFMEGSVASSPRSGSAQQKHEIFLSHSGAQKAFVRRVRNALERNAYCPFFDEDPDCLPKGEPFAHRIKTASLLADVAVVVLSDDFFTSKWPMIELAIFIKEQKRRKSLPDLKELKILPLFMGFSVEEFRNTERQTYWQNKWNEMRVGDDRIDVSVWKEALKVLGGTNGLEYCRYKNEEEYIDSIMSAIFKLVTPDLKWEDSCMKGKSKFHQAVAKIFASSPSKTRFHNVRAIGLYGVGGIGKTTLCKSLCNDYRGKFNGKVWHAELGKNNAEEIQKDVLCHLVGTSETFLKTTLNCKDQWQSLLRKRIEYKVFLAIDNVWNEDISRKQAEVLLEMGFHADSLVIVTSRSREVLEWLGIHEDCCFEMPVLDKSDATEVLIHSMAPGFDIQSLADDQRSAVDKAVERCFMMKAPISSAGSEKQYVPLALEVLGRELRVPLLRDTSRQNDNTSASVSESLVHCEVFDAILRILEDPERNGLVERLHGTGLVYDGAVTGLNTAGKGEFAPVGFVAGVDHAIKTGNADGAFNAAELPIADAAAGFLYGKSKTTPAAEPLARPPRRPSDPGNHQPFPVVPDSAPQISLADLRGNIDTAALVKEFRTPLDVTRGLESGQGYDFVRIQDGSCRAISHADAAQARNILKISGKRVGHTSLVEPGASVVAAGEIHVNAKGVWKNINCQSGHFQVPLEIMEGQMGRVFPRSVLTYRSPTWNCVLSVANHFTHVAVYTTSLIAVLNTQSTSPPLASSTFILAFHEHTAVKTIALGDVDFTHAKQAFDAVQLIFAKVLVQKPTNTVLCRHGLNEYVDMCIQQVRQINAVFPHGNWRKTSKDLESCFDPETGMFVLRCSCANRYGDWVVNSLEFLPEDRFDNQDGKLVQLIGALPFLCPCFLYGKSKTTPAAEPLARPPRRPSDPGNYKPFPVVPDSAQISLADLRGNIDTAALVKEFRTPLDVTRGLESGQGYDFVRIQDGSCRAISHADAAQARNILKISGKRVGHTSLVESGASVVAAGEIHVNAKGVWKKINCQGGHFQVPLEIMEGQMGRVFPRSVLTYRSPTWNCVLSVANHFTHVAVYTTSLIAVLNTQSTSPPLASSTFILAFHEHTAVKTIALGDVDFTHAKQAFDAVLLIFAKVLVQKPTNTVLCQHGRNEYVDMCIQQVQQINAVFPQGNWRKTSKDLESCFDPETGMFVLRCSCANRCGGWVVNSVEFLPEDRFDNQNGKLVQLN